MSRYVRARQSGGGYFFTVVTCERRPLLARPEVVERLRQAFRRVMAERPFTVDAMVVLPDHLHCLWRLPPDDADFSERWRQIKRFVSIGVAAEKNQRGEKALWQRRFWEHLVRDEEDWRRHCDYIHYNPVRHGYVANPADWPYSSFAAAVAKGWYEPGWGESLPPALEQLDFE